VKGCFPWSVVLERVVVTGVGVIAPNAHGKEPFAKALREGKSGIRFHQHLRDAGFGCQLGGIPEGVAALRSRYFSEEQLLAMNSNMTHAAIAAIDAWTDAELPRPAPDGQYVDWDSGAIIGAGIGGVDTIGEKVVPGTNAGRVTRLGSTLTEQAVISSNSAVVGGLLALGNRVVTSAAACATGTDAIVEAFFRIRDGRARRMLAGSSEGDSKYAWAPLDAMKVLCRTHNDAPETASRPMSASAAGFVPAAGAGVMVLESLSSAEERGASIYAEVIGGHANCGGQRTGGSMSAPNPAGIERCIRAAVVSAGVRPEEIDAINGHLTATFADPLEIASWSRALELPPDKMPLLHSTKSLIGHALGAAGGIECVASVLELHGGFVHGSLNCEDLHPALAPYAGRIPHQTVDVPDMTIIAKASFGFGDVNGCVLFRKFEADDRARRRKSR
jgi:3-oxoacyl-(acyl-carrier-protein) synthase